MKNIIISAFITLSFMACGDNKQAEMAKTPPTVTTETKADVKTDTIQHVHVYACPMHPEITGKEGDKCQKCGMALEHND